MHLSKELRIDNWILKNKRENFEPLQVDGQELLLIERAEIETVFHLNYKPIKLSKDILLQSGVKYMIEDCYSIQGKIYAGRLLPWAKWHLST